MQKQYKVLGVAIVKNNQPAAVSRPGADRGTIFCAAFLISFVAKLKTGMAAQAPVNQVVAGVRGAPLLLLEIHWCGSFKMKKKKQTTSLSLLVLLTPQVSQPNAVGPWSVSSSCSRHFAALSLERSP